MATYLPFVESDPNADSETLCDSMNQRSYLFFRNLVPAEVILQARREVIEILAAPEHNWLSPKHAAMHAIVREGQEPLTEGKPAYMAAYRKILKLPSFHNLPCHPALMQVAGKLLNHAEPFVHPRRIGRVTFPNNEIATTPAHQDHFYIRGAVETYSCWVPLGEIPLSLGGLAMLPQTHTQGFLAHEQHIEGAVGGRGVLVDEDAATWHISDFGVGDAVFFHAYTIHKAMPNLSGNQLRLSTDNRYQRPLDAIDPGALRPHYDLA